MVHLQLEYTRAQTATALVAHASVEFQLLQDLDWPRKKESKKERYINVYEEAKMAYKTKQEITS